MIADSENPWPYDHLFKIVLMGFLGKTELVSKYVKDLYPVDKNTIGFDFFTKIESIMGARVKLQIWDKAQQENYNIFLKQYFRGAQGIILCLDLCDRADINELKLRLEKELELAKPYLPEKYVPYVLVGTRADKVSERKISTTIAENLAASLGTIYIETSSAWNLNVSDVFVTIAKMIYHRFVANEENLGAPKIVRQLAHNTAMQFEQVFGSSDRLDDEDGLGFYRNTNQHIQERSTLPRDVQEQVDVLKLKKLSETIKLLKVLRKVFSKIKCNKDELSSLQEYLLGALTGIYKRKYESLNANYFKKNKMNTLIKYSSYLEKLQELLAPLSLSLQYDVCMKIFNEKRLILGEGQATKHEKTRIRMLLLEIKPALMEIVKAKSCELNDRFRISLNSASDQGDRSGIINAYIADCNQVYDAFTDYLPENAALIGLVEVDLTDLEFAAIKEDLLREIQARKIAHVKTALALLKPQVEEVSAVMRYCFDYKKLVSTAEKGRPDLESLSTEQLRVALTIFLRSKCLNHVPAGNIYHYDNCLAHPSYADLTRETMLKILQMLYVNLNDLLSEHAICVEVSLYIHGIYERLDGHVTDKIVKINEKYADVIRRNSQLNQEFALLKDGFIKLKLQEMIIKSTMAKKLIDASYQHMFLPREGEYGPQERFELLFSEASYYREPIDLRFWNIQSLPFSNKVDLTNLKLLLAPGQEQQLPPLQLKQRYAGLIHAIKSGDAFVVESHLNRGLSPNCTLAHENGCTPFMVACVQRNAKMVALLINYGADIHLPFPDNRKVIERVAREGDLAAVKVLLAAGAELNLHTACYLGDIEYLQNQVPPEQLNCADQDGQFPLQIAVIMQQIELLKWLLNLQWSVEGVVNRVYVDAAMHEMDRPLAIAVRNGQLESVQLLLQHNAQVTIEDLCAACEKNHRMIANLLFPYVKNPSLYLLMYFEDQANQIKAKVGENYLEPLENHLTPLAMACRMRNRVIVSWLYEQDSPPNVYYRCHKQDKVALDYAVEGGSVEIIRLLIENVENIDFFRTDHDLNPAIVSIVERGHVSMLAEVLNCTKKRIPHQFKERINAGYGEKWETVLHKAARCGHVDVVRLLLEHGAEPFAENLDGNLPLDFAAKMGHHEIKAMLQEGTIEFPNLAGKLVRGKVKLEVQPEQVLTKKRFIEQALLDTPNELVVPLKTLAEIQALPKNLPNITKLDYAIIESLTFKQRLFLLQRLPNCRTLVKGNEEYHRPDLDGIRFEVELNKVRFFAPYDFFKVNSKLARQFYKFIEIIYGKNFAEFSEAICACNGGDEYPFRIELKGGKGKTALWKSASPEYKRNSNNMREVSDYCFIYQVKQKLPGRVYSYIYDHQGVEAKKEVLDFLRPIRGVILCVDLTNAQEFSKLLECYDNELKMAQQLEKKHNIITYLVGTKSDLKEERTVSREDVELFAKKHGLMYIETSAKTGENVEAVFENLTSMLFDASVAGYAQNDMCFAKLFDAEDPDFEYFKRLVFWLKYPEKMKMVDEWEIKSALDAQQNCVSLAASMRYRFHDMGERVNSMGVDGAVISDCQGLNV